MITELGTQRKSPKTYANNGEFSEGTGRKLTYWYQEATYTHVHDQMT